ncbi:MAG: MAPEG family protein [Sphaerospermopsis sp. SIO1G2]|nr:MAPEG family protein [Sphaerospermopsis sp. SIO1G1]NET73346.1 MAPEG family protein [Sphaerospermopsis sp. SIO1G2]
MSLLLLSVPNIFLYSIVAAAILIYLPFLLVAIGRVQVGNDLSAPRAMFDKLPIYAQRATWAHQNSFEAFMIFAAAAFMAYVTGVNSQSGMIAAIAFVIARFFYSVFYITNIPILRSLMFAIGVSCHVTLFYLSILQVQG